MKKKFTVIFEGTTKDNTFLAVAYFIYVFDDFLPGELNSSVLNDSFEISGVTNFGETKSFSESSLFSYKICFRLSDNLDGIQNPCEIEVKDIFSENWRYWYHPPNKKMLKKWFTDILKKYYIIIKERKRKNEVL